jgi:Flp pilus assembly protein TadG
MLLGVVDFGMALSQNISLQGAAREGARQGVTQGDVIATTSQAKGSLDDTKLEVKFVVDSSAGAPGVMVVCLRYPQSSLSGFYSWALGGFFEAKAVMKMEGTAATTSGAKNWTGGSCTP